MSTAWPQIETAMAYQIGLPIVVWREKSVRAEGLFEPGVAGLYMPEFDAALPAEQ